MGGGGAGCSISACELMAVIILIGIAVGGTPKPRAPESWEGGHEGSPRARDAQAHSTFSAAGKGGTPKLIPGSRGWIGVTQARPTFPGARKGHTKAYPVFPQWGNPRLTPIFLRFGVGAHPDSP